MKKNTNKRSIKASILSIAITPVIVLGIVVILLFNTMLSKSTNEDTMEHLRGSALTVLTAYNQNPGDYIAGAGGGLWKGNFSIGDSKDLVTSIGESAGIDICFYSTDQCLVSTIDGIEESNMAFPEDILKVTMEEKYDYMSYNYNVNGVPSYVYAVTVFQERSDEEVVGTILVSADVATKKASMNNIIKLTAVIVSIVALIVIILGVIVVNALTGAINEGVRNIELVSTGNLALNIKDKFLKRKDELGTMNNALAKLVNELRRMIKGSIEQVNKLQESAIHLDETAQNTKDSIETVNEVVSAMTEAAEVQYSTSKKVSDAVEVLDGILSKTYEEIINLDTTKNGMQEDGINIQKVVGELIYINESLNNIIALVNAQIDKTNASAKNIKKFAQQITSFADETNLLSMNASIEAVRVGEEGKGFAIVAGQIKELADQSALVSENIEEEIKELLRGSNKTIRRMDDVNKVIGRMNDNIDVTTNVFNRIKNSINVMSGNVETIKGKIKTMEDKNEEIIEVIDDLKKAARKNSKVASESGQVADYMSELFDEASAINTVSKKLVESMDVFKL